MTSSESPLRTENDNEETRRCAVHALLGAPLEQCHEQLWTALGDTSWRVRKEAVEVVLAAKPTPDQISSLINLLRDEDNAGLRNATAELVVRLGKKAVPALLAHLHDADHDLRKLVVDALATIGGKDVVPGLISALDDDDVNVAAAAAEGLGISGSAAAVQPLLRVLESHDHDFFRYNVLAALGKIGVPTPLPPIIRELAGRDMLRRGLYECLGRIGNDPAAAEIVLEGVMSPLPSLQQTAIRALANIVRTIAPLFRESIVERLRSLADQGLIERLLECYRSDELENAAAAVYLLAQLNDLRGVPVLMRALCDERLAADAEEALLRLGPIALQEACVRFGQADETGRKAMCLLIGKLAVASPEVEQLLAMALTDESDQVRRVAVLAVGRLPGGELLSKVVVLLDDADGYVREAALQTLRLRSSCDRELICETALQMLASDQPARRQGAALLFAAAGEGERLAQLMKDVDPAVRESAVRAVGRLRLSGSCSSLIMALVDEVEDVRIAAAEALGSCCDGAAVAPLRLALQDHDSWVQAAALRSLMELAGDEALPDVIELWQRGDEVAQLACLEVFDLLNDRKGFELISQGLGSRDGEVLKSAINILADHAPDLLQPWQQHILYHHDWDVRMSAVRACCSLPEAERGVLLRMALEHEHHDLVKLEIQRLLDRV